MSERLVVNFGPEQGEALDRLAGELHTSRAGILRYGLMLMQLAVAESRKGNAVGVIRDGQPVKELCGPWQLEGSAA